MDAAAVSRALSHGVALEVKFQSLFPVGDNGERVGSYTVAIGCHISGTQVARSAALADLINFQTPADVRLIEDWLAELSVISASRARDEMESAMTVNAYASRLQEYPADIVRDALLVRTWKWWPTWDELRKHCEAKAGPRRQMIAALQQPEPEPQPRKRPATDDEKVRIQMLIDDMFPNRSPEMRKAAVTEALRGNCMTEDVECSSPTHVISVNV